MSRFAFLDSWFWVLGSIPAGCQKKAFGLFVFGFGFGIFPAATL